MKIDYHYYRRRRRRRQNRTVAVNMQARTPTQTHRDIHMRDPALRLMHHIMFITWVRAEQNTRAYARLSMRAK